MEFWGPCSPPSSPNCKAEGGRIFDIGSPGCQCGGGYGNKDVTDRGRRGRTTDFVWGPCSPPSSRRPERGRLRLVSRRPVCGNSRVRPGQLRRPLLRAIPVLLANRVRCRVVGEHWASKKKVTGTRGRPPAMRDAVVPDAPTTPRSCGRTPPQAGGECRGHEPPLSLYPENTWGQTPGKGQGVSYGQ